MSFDEEQGHLMPQGSRTAVLTPCTRQMHEQIPE